MEISQQIQGQHATVSPSGSYLALISTGKVLRICAAHAPERCTEVNIRMASKDVVALKWNDDSTRIAVLSAQVIEVIDLDDAGHRIRIDNGSAGLGRFTTAAFVGSDQLLAVWEFGKAKIWDLTNGKSVELSDFKTVCSGDRWQMRPGSGSATPRTLAILSRPGAEDMLNLYLPAQQKHFASVKLPTIDAQSILWSSDGRWLAVLDVPTANPSVHFYTPDGHRFRSHPLTAETDSSALGVKAVVWSPNSNQVGLAGHDGKITLLNARTFTPLAVIEHTTTIDQRSLPPELQAPIWQETVSASGERSYVASPQPVSPPLSKAKASTEPAELGVAEASFSCDGSYFATRDERMLNTVWIWNMATLTAHAVIIQHSNVRKLHWHPSRAEILMMDCGEGIPYQYDAASSQPPMPMSFSAPGSTLFSWLKTLEHSHSMMLAATKSSLRILFPDGHPGDSQENDQTRSGAAAEASFDEGESEDSLFNVLSGRKPLPPKTEQSYTERIEVETEEEDTVTRMDDTFREIRKSRRPVPVDPLDDSQIF